MLVAVIAGAVGLLAVLLATYGGDAALDPDPGPDPGWEPLPAPNDVARPAFPFAFAGYDPATVDATVEALVVAYEELYEAASPETRERARRAATRRRGRAGPSETLAPAVSALAGEDAAATPDPLAPGDEPGVVLPSAARPDEALRAAAALAAIERRR